MNPERPLTILHVSDMQFGANHRFEADKSLGVNLFDTLTSRLKRDLDELREHHGLHPDILICTGDVAECGFKSEFLAGFKFLADIAAHLGLGRERVVVIPGNHDINRDDCVAYFALCKGDETEPLLPWFPKLNKYKAAFEEFYKDCKSISFTPDEPWSLFPVPDLKVVVAGLNSTMRDGHPAAVDTLPATETGHYGWCGEPQLRWFEEKLADLNHQGWLRIGAVHHNQQRGCKSDDENLRDADALQDILDDSLDMVLHGHTHQAKTAWIHPKLPVYSTGSAALGKEIRPDEVPNQYQILQVFADRVRRYSRCYYPEKSMWGADVRGSKTGEKWITEDKVDFSNAISCFVPVLFDSEEKNCIGHANDRENFTRHSFLSQVAEACALHYPQAKIEQVPRKADRLNYLRVTCRESGIIRQFAIGTSDDKCGGDELNRFYNQVVLHYRANDPGLIADFVYGGREAASPEARHHAGALRIRLRSFIEYQGLIDFRDYIRGQTNRLTSDATYPPALYVAQRMQFEIGIERSFTSDAFETVANWLRETDPRFVLILGEFGTGKTFLLYELARRLAVDPAITPILVELRALEKARSVDQLLASHFARHPVDCVYADDRLRYMIREGRVTLLFDGFDELALRVGFERAADHLDTLIQAADGNARIVVTSRTSHFENDKQVRLKLGDHVTRVRGLRYCRLQRFDEDQIRSFLHNRFPAAGEANIWFELIREVKDLLGLSEIPRMLSFITALDRKKLEQAQDKSGSVSAAELYRLLIVDHWLEHEYQRVNPPGAANLLARNQIFSAMIQLALKLWEKTDRWISLKELTGETENILEKLAPEKMPYQPAAVQQLGSGTLLVRDDEGRFTFVHQSILEWCVASAAASALNTSQEPLELTMHEISALMADFLISLAGENAIRWASTIIHGPAASSGITNVSVQNAITIRNRLGDKWPVGFDTPVARMDLTGKDLRGQDLTEHNLVSAILRDADLRDTHLVGCNLTDAVLSGAQLGGARMNGSVLRRADLTNAQGSEASLLGVDLTGAKLSGSQWRRAKLLGVISDKGAFARADTFGAAFGGIDTLKIRLSSPASQANSIDWNPDKTVLASAHSDGSICLWEAATGREILQFQGHTASIRCVAWNPAGDRLASASHDKTLRIWEASTGRGLLKLQGHTEAVMSVAWNPAGDRLVSASHDKTLRIWESSTGRELLKLQGHTDSAWSVAWNPAGDRLASTSFEKMIRIWETSTGRELFQLQGHTSPVLSVVWNRAGDRIASASDDKTVRIWEAASGCELLKLQGHTGSVGSVAWDPTGNRLASTSNDKTLRIWEAASGRELLKLQGHTEPVWSVAWNPTGDRLASASYDTTIRIWEAASGRELLKLQGHTGSVGSVAWDPTDDRIASSISSDNTVRVWEAASGRQLLQLQGHTSSVSSVAWNPAGDRLASASDDNTVRVWEAASGRQLLQLQGHTDSVMSVAWNSAGNCLASASSDNTVRIWEASSGREILQLQGHTRSVMSVAWNPAGDCLASVSSDNTVRIWEASNGREILQLQGHTASVLSVAWNPAGDHLASVSLDNTVRLWETSKGREILQLQGHTRSVMSVAWNPTGNRIASASFDKTVRLWDVASGREILQLQGHTASVLSVAWNPAGDRIASASRDNTVRIWDANSGKCLAILIGAAEGWAVIREDGRFKSGGNVLGAFWHQAGLCRFEPGELDTLFPELRLRDDELI